MGPNTARTADAATRWPWAVGLAGALFLGAFLRLVWVADIEYKVDESWTFHQTQEVGRTRPFPWLGMSSSAHVRNPGLSLWVFLLLGKLFAVAEPTDLARAVQLCNVAALVLLVWFALRAVGAGEREPWLWAAALVAVNPLAVLFHRKIWPPSLLPLLTLLLLAGWRRRERPAGAFTWGLVGACVGQIHMGGFFFAAGFAAWALLFDRRVAWKAWLAGSVLGALPMIPWLYYLATEPVGGPSGWRWYHLIEFKFWLRWATEPLGIGIEYALEEDYTDYLRYPLLDGRPTYLVGVLHGLVALIGAAILARACWLLRQDRQTWRDRWADPYSFTAFTQGAALWGFGILLTLSSLPIPRHYTIILFPLEFVWLARLALAGSERGLKWGRSLLATLCLAQFLLSLSFLGYIHVHPCIHGDYGVVYGAQGGFDPLSTVESPFDE
jgi:hypothetical protein